MDRQHSYAEDESDIRVDQFDASWHSGTIPCIDDFLPSERSGEYDSAKRYRLLVELVMTDLECRWRRIAGDFPSGRNEAGDDTENSGEPLPGLPHLEDYVATYPQLGPLNRLPVELIVEEYRVRQRWGDRPGHHEYLQRFPLQRQELGHALRHVDQQLPSPPQSVAVHIRCPHCHGAVELIDPRVETDVRCASCGTLFTILGDGVATGEPLDGRELGHFELLSQVGTGSFGTVWKARDTRLDRIVAIKIPRLGQIREEDVEQFLREARATAQLRHTSIVAVHEVGLESGTVYIVSEYVEGRSLAELMQQERLGPQESAELCMRIAEALDYAHTAGLVHRDLKPSNVMIDADGGPHIMDFGLAHREADEITMTLEGQILGTPAYMSPEQAMGQAHNADLRSDVYSLGVILFEMLAGDRPFRGNVRTLLHQVIHDDATSPRKLNSSIDRDLETICLKCLEKDPRNRYSTGRELADELRRFLSGVPILARPISPWGRTWRWSPVVTILAATAATLLILLAVMGPLVALNQAALAEQHRRSLYMSDMKVALQAWEAADVARASALLRRHVPTSPSEEDLRGFEWYYLWRLCKKSLNAQTCKYSRKGWAQR